VTDGEPAAPVRSGAGPATAGAAPRVEAPAEARPSVAMPARAAPNPPPAERREDQQRPAAGGAVEIAAAAPAAAAPEAAMPTEPAADAHSAVARNPALEQMIAQLLEPVLMRWLDANLPRMIDGIVRAEVARALNARS